MTESPFVDLDAGYIHYGMYGLKCKEYLPKLSPVLLHPLWDVWVEILDACQSQQHTALHPLLDVWVEIQIILTGTI